MKASKMDGLLDEVKSNLGQAIPPHQLKEKKVAKKVEKVEKKGKAKPEKEAKASKSAAASDEGMVTLADLAKEAKISGAAARRKIRASDLERDGRWAWKEGSKQLKTARSALGL